MENSRLCVYTVITGDCDELIAPTIVTKGCDYIFNNKHFLRVKH